MTWFMRNLLLTLFVPALAIFLLVTSINEASNIHNGNTVLAVGFLAGFIPIMIEFYIAWRNHTLFIRDQAIVAARQGRNRRIANLIIGPSIVFGILVQQFNHSLQAALASIASGYLLPFSIFLTIHFALHHKEIEKIASAIKTNNK